MATIDKIKSTSPLLLLTKPIIPRDQIAYLLSLFDDLFPMQSFAHAKNKKFDDKESSSSDQCLDFYMETSNRTWV
jgi:hypothetical protein